MGDDGQIKPTFMERTNDVRVKLAKNRKQSDAARAKRNDQYKISERLERLKKKDLSVVSASADDEQVDSTLENPRSPTLQTPTEGRNGQPDDSASPMISMTDRINKFKREQLNEFDKLMPGATAKEENSSQIYESPLEEDASLFNQRQGAPSSRHGRVTARDRSQDAGPPLSEMNKEIDSLKKQIKAVTRQNSKKFRKTKVYEILPGYSIHSYMCYPDLNSLRQHKPHKFQPMCMGAYYFSFIAQFGDQKQVSTGLEKDKEKVKLQTSINQLEQSERIAKVEYEWQKYENEDNSLFYYSFKFFSKDGTLLGNVNNLSEQQF